MNQIDNHEKINNEVQNEYHQGLVTNRFNVGDKVFYLVLLKNEDGKKLFFGEGNIQAVYNTKIKEALHFCYEFAEHEIVIDQKSIMLPKRVVVDDNVFISNEEVSEFLKNDGTVTQID